MGEEGNKKRNITGGGGRLLFLYWFVLVLFALFLFSFACLLTVLFSLVASVAVGSRGCRGTER